MESKVLFPPFSFAFQPVINISTGSIYAYEALARGCRNEPANQVFQQVDKTNLYQFDEILRQKAISLAAKLGIGCNLSLNLLPQTLLHSQTALASSLTAAKSVGIPPELLTIEVMESELIDDICQFAKLINQYRETGISLAIDDFGSGYSGLNLLADFQPDSVKIDLSLIRSIDTRGPRQAIVRGIIRTCQDLGIDIIAEGVETQADWNLIVQIGCNEVQGYYVARPMPASEFIAWKDTWESHRTTP